MIRELPPFLRDMLASPPHAGEGVHNWLFGVARHLHAHYTAPGIISLLETRVANCGRIVTRKEIEDAVKASIGCAWQPHGSAPATPAAVPKWPNRNLEQIEAIAADAGPDGLWALWEASPFRFEGDAEQMIDLLFPGNPLLCCGRSNSSFDTRPRENWRGELSNLQLIVPSPMTAVDGVTKEGKQSRHTLSNTGPRRFLVCEFDSGTIDEQAALLLHLAYHKGPMVCALHSGGKSLHGWFYVESKPDRTAERFFRYAVSLGADRAAWTKSQFMRMPGGLRDNGKRQEVFFLNPGVIH